jgi:hypothetical protein
MDYTFKNLRNQTVRKKVFIALLYEVSNGWSFGKEKKIEKKLRVGGKAKIFLLNPFTVGAKCTQAFAGKSQKLLVLWLVVYNSVGRKDVAYFAFALFLQY